jgi:hypothetical protein
MNAVFIYKIICLMTTMFLIPSFNFFSLSHFPSFFSNLFFRVGYLFLTCMVPVPCFFYLSMHNSCFSLFQNIYFPTFSVSFFLLPILPSFLYCFLIPCSLVLRILLFLFYFHFLPYFNHLYPVTLYILFNPFYPFIRYLFYFSCSPHPLFVRYDY